MKHLDLFSGIGGFALAAETVWPNIQHTFCDNDPFCQEVLKKHWPGAKIYGDIRTLTGRYPINEDFYSCFLLTGGFPCQPFSQAGRRKGTNDDRHLWPEMLRVIREFRPRWVIGENVAGLLTIEQGVVFEQVCSDLEAEGYEVQPFIIPAVSVNAPHRRDRVWIVGHAKHDGFNGTENREGGNQGGDSDKKGKNKFCESKRTDSVWENAPDSKSEGLERRSGGEPSKPGDSRHSAGSGREWDKNWLEVATRLCRVDDGLPRRLDRNPRLKALGNAIVPQVAIEIMQAIKKIDS